MATVKGTWRFNDVLTVPNTNFDVKVVFITPDYDSYKWYGIRHFNKTTQHCISYKDSDLSGWVQYLFKPYAGSDVGWMHPECRTIVFETEQEVSDEFYEWFTANATPQAKTKVFKRLYSGDTVATSGTRVFKKLTTAEVTPEDPTLPIWNGTDLTGTTWRISSVGLTVEAGYGEFDVIGKEDNLDFYDLRIGYKGYNKNSFEAISHSATADYVCWSIVYLTGMIGYRNIYKTEAGVIATRYCTLTFTGGTDVTNPRLIDWLLQNAKLTSHQLDLLGTWVFNNTITELPVFDDTVEDAYNNSGNNYARYINLNLFSKSGALAKPRNLLMCNQLASGYGGDTLALCAMSLIAEPFYYYERNAFLQEYYWSETAYNELTFKDGSTFTNYSGVYVGEKLLAWLRANARKK